MSDQEIQQHNDKERAGIVISRQMAEWFVHVGRRDLLELCYISVRLPVTIKTT